MGRDKSRLKLGGRTLLARIRATANALGPPVRVIRRDAVRRCGPLGGIYTALKSTKSLVLLFLACDMPLITSEILRRALKRLGPRDEAVFARTADGLGFPFVLRGGALAMVEARILRREFSLHGLARELKAQELRLPRRQLQNVNTPAELERARKFFRKP